MSKIILGTAFIFFLAPFLTAAQEATTTAESESGFVESVDIDDGVLHYNGDSTVAGTLAESWHDTDGDGSYDAWFVYENDIVVRESYDTNGDATPDLVLELNQNGVVTDVSGTAAADYEVPEPAQFTPERIDITGGEDLVGDLSDIGLEKKTTNSWIFFVLMFLVGGALYLFWQRQK